MIKVRKNTINKAKLLSKRAFFCIIVSQNRKITSKLLIITKKWLSGVLSANSVSEKEIFLMTCDPTAKYYIVKKEAVK